jgi:hypothetical protein
VAGQQLTGLRKRERFFKWKIKLTSSEKAKFNNYENAFVFKNISHLVFCGISTPGAFLPYR